jgi:hypothetical protein
MYRSHTAQVHIHTMMCHQAIMIEGYARAEAINILSVISEDTGLRVQGNALFVHEKRLGAVLG